MKRLGLIAAAVVGLGLLLVGGAGLSGTGLVSMITGASALPSAAAVADIPAAMLSLYQTAASASCEGFPWTVLAAIGTVESDNGQSDLPGVHAGANSAGAEGPMQFLAGTFAAYDQPIPPGGATPPNPYDPIDAVYAAARLLCADGGAGSANLSAAVYAYNHSAAYVSQVLSLATSYAAVLSPTVAPQLGPATAAVDWALQQVGTPYEWGGENPGVGFDCSGLVQAAYFVAGIALPRVAQSQFDAGPALPFGAALEPGDLVFFGQGARDVTHVGMVVMPGFMVDAPNTGAKVRVEAFPDRVGAHWGDDVVVGFTRPSA